MTRRARRSLAALTLLLLTCIAASPARSELVDLGGSTFDTETLLEWLDLTSTVNVRPMDILMREDPDRLLDAGWRYASFDEIATFWTHAGLSAPFDGSPRDRSGVLGLMGMIGITGEQAGGRFVAGYAPDGAARLKGPWHLPVLSVSVDPSGSGAAVVPGPFMGLGLDLFADPNIGSWLVRPLSPTEPEHRSWGSIKARYHR